MFCSVTMSNLENIDCNRVDQSSVTIDWINVYWLSNIQPFQIMDKLNATNFLILPWVSLIASLAGIQISKYHQTSIFTRAFLQIIHLILWWEKIKLINYSEAMHQNNSSFFCLIVGGGRIKCTRRKIIKIS